MVINKNYIYLYLPLLLLVTFGREYKGLGIETMFITLSIGVSLLFATELRSRILSLKVNFYHALFVLYCVVNYIVNIDNKSFNVVDFMEDIYSFYIFLFFFMLALVYYQSAGSVYKRLNQVIIIGLILNLALCLHYYGGEWGLVFFQRLWNPYLLAFIPMVMLVQKNRMYLFALIPTAIALFLFSSSFQIAVCFVFVLAIMSIPNRYYSLIDWRVFGGLTLLAFLSIQVMSLILDPITIANLDHNFGVRAVFWHEALEYFAKSPLGFGLGVTAVTGDMSLIGEGLFQGGASVEDIGVHSGVMSLLYKFGVFSIFAFYIIVRSLFGFGKGDIDNRGYLILLFVFLLSFFSNDSIFTPHFSASLGFILGILYKNAMYQPSMVIRRSSVDTGI